MYVISNSVSQIGVHLPHCGQDQIRAARQAGPADRDVLTGYTGRGRRFSSKEEVGLRLSDCFVKIRKGMEVLHVTP